MLSSHTDFPEIVPRALQMIPLPQRSSVSDIALPTHVKARKRFVLGRRASLWVSFGVAVHTLWTSAAPALSYRLYAEDWHLSPLDTTGVFAIYPVFVVATLTLLGNLSDHLGRRLTMLAALAGSLIGALMLAFANDLAVLLIARAIMGVGVGLASGSSTAAILEYSVNANPERAAATTNVAQAMGFTAALLLNGALIEYAPWPLRLDFLVLAGLIVGLIVAVWFLPPGATASRRWSPRLPSIPAVARSAFVTAALAATCAFAAGAVILSLGGQVAHDLVGSSNIMINGAILASFAIVSATITAIGRKRAPKLSLALGATAVALGMALLWSATCYHSLVILLAATSITGIGYALLFLGAFTLINTVAPVNHRGGVLSALYLVGDLSMGSFGYVLGGVARVWGLASAIAVGSTVLTGFCVIAFVCSRTLGSDSASGH